MPTLNVYDLPARSVTEFWPLAAPLLQRVLKYHPFMASADEVLELLVTGNASLIIYTEAGELVGAAVMEIHCYPRRRVANILALSGKSGFLKRIAEAELALQDWSKTRGCDSMSMLGRPGWSKTVGALGYSQRPALNAWKSLQGPA